MAVAFVREAPDKHAEFLSYGLAAFVPALSPESAQHVLDLVADSDDGAAQSLVAAATAVDKRFPEFVAALEKKASKPKPRPALKKGGSAKGARKRIAFEGDGDGGRGKPRVAASAANAARTVSGAAARRPARKNAPLEDEIEDADDDGPVVLTCPCLSTCALPPSPPLSFRRPLMSSGHIPAW